LSLSPDGYMDHRKLTFYTTLLIMRVPLERIYCSMTLTSLVPVVHVVRQTCVEFFPPRQSRRLCLRQDPIPLGSSYADMDATAHVFSSAPMPPSPTIKPARLKLLVVFPSVSIIVPTQAARPFQIVPLHLQGDWSFLPAPKTSFLNSSFLLKRPSLPADVFPGLRLSAISSIRNVPVQSFGSFERIYAFPFVLQQRSASDMSSRFSHS